MKWYQLSPEQWLHLFGENTRREEWISFIGILCVGLALVLAMSLTINTLFRRLFPKLEQSFGMKLGRALRTPLAFLILVYFLIRATDVFKGMPGWVWQWKTDVAPYLYAVLLITLAFRILDTGVNAMRMKWKEKNTDLDEDVAVLMGRFVKLTLILIVLLIVLQNLGVQILGLLAGLGFLGAAMALAAQSTIANIIGYFEILGDKLFRVGDRISFGDADGFVEQRGLRCVRMRSIYGERITIPNKEVVEKQIRNHTRAGFSEIIFNIGLVYDTSRGQIEEAMNLLRSVFDSMPKVNHHEVVFRSLGASSLDLQARAWADYGNVEELNALLSEGNLKIKESFDQAGIPFAFPTQTLEIKGYPEPKSAA